MDWWEWAAAWDRTALFWPVYFAPFLVALLRRSENLGMIFMLNLLLGWTIVGWFVAWIFVFDRVRDFVLSPLYARYANRAGGGATNQVPSPVQQGAKTCPDCNGFTVTSCSHCHGRGSWTEIPQGQNIPVSKHCGHCYSTGTVTCRTCEGSGYVR